MVTQSPDDKFGGETRQERVHERLPWLPTILASVIGALILVFGSWSVTNSSKNLEIMKADYSTLATRMENLENRQNRLEERITHLEQLRMALVVEDDSQLVMSN